MFEIKEVGKVGFHLNQEVVDLFGEVSASQHFYDIRLVFNAIKKKNYIKSSLHLKYATKFVCYKNSLDIITKIPSFSCLFK